MLLVNALTLILWQKMLAATHHIDHLGMPNLWRCKLLYLRHADFSRGLVVFLSIRSALGLRKCMTWHAKHRNLIWQ